MCISFQVTWRKDFVQCFRIKYRKNGACKANPKWAKIKCLNKHTTNTVSLL